MTHWETRECAVRRGILGWLEVPVNESLWFHAMEVGHTLGTLKTPAHGMGSSVKGEGLSTMQHCGQENTVTTTNRQNTSRGTRQKAWLGHCQTQTQSQRSYCIQSIALGQVTVRTE